MTPLQRLLESEGTLLLDGAMGTMLMSRGLVSGDPPEEWNMTFPENIRWVHRQYIEAGSRLILTNTFGGSRFRLKLHNLQERVIDINRAAAVNARAEADAVSHTVLVAGSIGPSGELLYPLGDLTFEEAAAGFAEQATGLMQGGVDILWIETMSDLNEVKAAIEGIRSVCDLPICATLSFDTNGNTMMGVSPAQAAETLSSLGLAAIGANCGNNLADTERAISQMHAVAPQMLLISKANAGIPQWVRGEQIYDGTPQVMAEYACHVRNLGAKLIGACCGSSPEHIRAMDTALALTEYVPVTMSADNEKEYESTDDSSNNRKRQRRRRRL